MTTQTYIPSEEELKEMGFFLSLYWSLGIPGGNIYYSQRVEGVREEASWLIYFYGSSIGARIIYPTDKAHLQSIILAFQPQQLCNNHKSYQK